MEKEMEKEKNIIFMIIVNIPLKGCI